MGDESAAEGATCRPNNSSCQHETPYETATCCRTPNLRLCKGSQTCCGNDCWGWNHSNGSRRGCDESAPPDEANDTGPAFWGSDYYVNIADTGPLEYFACDTRCKQRPSADTHCKTDIHCYCY